MQYRLNNFLKWQHWASNPRRSNLGIILVRVCEPVFRNQPLSYTWPLKNGPIHILIIWNVYPFIYCPLIFCTHLLLVVRQILQSSREQATSKISEWKICAYTGMSEKEGPFIYQKLGQSYTFCRKKVASHIPDSAEKGSHSARTSVLCHILCLTPLPPPTPPSSSNLSNTDLGVQKGLRIRYHFTKQEKKNYIEEMAEKMACFVLAWGWGTSPPHHPEAFCKSSVCSYYE